VELVTVAVSAAPVFDALFSGMVTVNEEGAAVSTEAGRPTVGIPFKGDLRIPLDTRTATRLSSFSGSWPSSRVGHLSWLSTARAPRSATSCTWPTWRPHSPCVPA
jgi:hypothetical protein